MNRIKRHLAYALAIITISLPAWGLPAGPTLAQTDTEVPTPPRIKDVRPSENPLRFDGSIEVEFNEDVSKFSPNAQINLGDFELSLNGHPMHGLSARHHDNLNNAIVFKLKPDDSSKNDDDRNKLKQSWRDVLQSPKPDMSLKVGLNYDGKPVRYEKGPEKPIKFKVYTNWTLILFLFSLAGVVVALIYLDHKSDILRDSGPPTPGNGRRTYSLALTQMAFWTVLVLAAFGFLYIVTQDYATVTPESMTLLGISTVTALAAVIIDTKKDSEYLVSEGFWVDILEDKNGVTLHRLQIVVWTLVLGTLFVWEVFGHLTMPAFSNELLTLMGISSGAYLGFKIPEKHVEVEKGAKTSEPSTVQEEAKASVT